MVFKPLCIVRERFGALSSGHILEINERLPCAGDTERVAIHLRKSIHEIHAAIEVAHPCNRIFVERLEVAGDIKLNEFLNHQALLLVFSIRQRLLQVFYHFLKCSRIESAFFSFENALNHVAFSILGKLAVETNPHRLG